MISNFSDRSEVMKHSCCDQAKSGGKNESDEEFTYERAGWGRFVFVFFGLSVNGGEEKFENFPDQDK